MSIKQYDFIEPQDFINLKNNVKKEIQRRNYKDLDKLYNLYGRDSYDFKITPSQNKTITYDDIETILKPLEAINKNTLGINPVKESSITYEDFNQITNTLNIFFKGQQRSNNTCSSSCIGMCIGCTDACTSCQGCTSCMGCTDCTGCSGSCNGCSGGCTSCVVQCGGGCGYCGSGGWSGSCGAGV